MINLQIHSLIHTSIRNIGLFTSIGIGLLAISRYYREKNVKFDKFFIVLSIVSLCISLVVNRLSLNTIKLQLQNNKEQEKYVKKYFNLYDIMGLLVLTLLVYNIVILFRLKV